ncbi:MAG: phosphotransferase [bacterium]|nr:phosphotransferase [bacterium]
MRLLTHPSHQNTREQSNGTTKRVHAQLELASGQVVPVFVKQPSSSRLAKLFVALPRLSQAEVAFYSQLQHQVPIATPHCYIAQHHHTNFILVLEDLSQSGATLRSATQALSPDEANDMLAALADMHRQWWERTTEYKWLAANCRREQALGRWLAPTLCRLGLHQARSVVPPELMEPIRRYARNRHAAQQAMQQGAATLIHNDPHPANQFVTAAGEPGLLDWQLCRQGPALRDVAYLLATSLTPNTRHNEEQNLLAEYLGRLGPLAPSPDKAWLLYRRNIVYATEAMLITAALKAMMPTPDALTLLERTCAAALDLEAFNTF